MGSEIVKHEHKNHGRIYCGFTRKYNLGNYESQDISISLSDDQKSDENLNQAFDRVVGHVQGQFESICEKFESNKPKTKGGK